MIIWRTITRLAFIGLVGLALGACGSSSSATANDSGAFNSDGMTSAGTGEIAVAGFACSPPGALACVGRAQQATLICNNGTWTASGMCPVGQYCDSSPGPNSGTCAPTDPLCSGLRAGEVTCSDSSHTVICGPDLLSHVPGTACVDSICMGGACTGVCSPGAVRCAGDAVQTCGITGQWGSSQACSTGKVCANGICQCPPPPDGGCPCDQQIKCVESDGVNYYCSAVICD